MNKNHAYKDCYEILNINPECSWSELRKSYKLQVHKWHPDRFHDKSMEKQLIAEKKIMEVNNAYNLLSTYYRDHGALPRIKIDSCDRSKTSQKGQTESKTHDNQAHTNIDKTYDYSNNKQNNKKNYLFTVIMCLGLISLYIFITFPDSTNDLSNQSIRTSPIENTIQNRKNTPKTIMDDNSGTGNKPTVDHGNQEEIQMQFTYGSSLSEVIQIQGTPTRVVGNTWYYGESRVVFKNGLVEYWVRKPGHHLHANIFSSRQTVDH